MRELKRFDLRFKELKDKIEKECMEFKKNKFFKRLFGFDKGDYKLQLLNSPFIESLCSYFYNEGQGDCTSYIYDIVIGDEK